MSKPTKDEMLEMFGLAWPDDGDSLDCWHCPYSGGEDRTCIFPEPDQWTCLNVRKAICTMIIRADAVERMVEAARNSIVWIENYPARQVVKTALAAFDEEKEGG